MNSEIIPETLSILVVDDNPINLLIMQEFLSDQHKVIAVDSGEKALKYVDRDLPDLILLDVMMPGIDGLETCRIIKKRQDLKNIKIILVSAKSTAKDIDAGVSAGADRYLVKPLEQDVLLESIEELFND